MAPVTSPHIPTEPRPDDRSYADASPDRRALPMMAQAVSLGSFCHAAFTLRRLALRGGAGPMDWIFSNPAATAHMLDDRFRTLLDPSQYQPVPPEQRLDPAANRCDHRVYRDQFGVRFLFNHQQPTDPLEYSVLQCRAARLLTALDGTAPLLCLMVGNGSLDVPDYQPVREALARHAAPTQLLVVHFVVSDRAAAEAPRVLLDDGSLHAVELPVSAPSRGTTFDDPADEARFEALLANWPVAHHSHDAHLNALTPHNFDEAWYRRRHPDVADAIARGELDSGWAHFAHHGRAEARAARRKRA